MNDIIVLHVRWRGITIIFDNVNTKASTVNGLKIAIEDKTGVAPCDQKLIGLGVKLTNATAADDRITLSEVSYKIKEGIVSIQLMGTPQVELIEQRMFELEQMKNNGKAVMNDLSLDISPATREWRKLQEFSKKAEIKFMNPPREGKKLLILDLDHTLMHFDSKEEGQSSSSTFNNYQSNNNVNHCNAMKRPFLEYFLSSVYPYYDIVVWSQTHWKWIEIKLVELGMLPNHHYKICFILDKSSMFKIPPTGYVKPLQIVWSQHPQWNKTNTLHVDDMERNFVLNKSSGLLVTPFYRSGYINHKNDILTATLSNHAYGPSGLVLDTIATTTNNSYLITRNYATGDKSQYPGVSFPALGSTTSSPPSDTTMLSQTVEDGSGTHAVMFRNEKLTVPTPSTTPANVYNITTTNSTEDVELYYLARYLVNIAGVTDLSAMNHSHWRLHCHYNIHLPMKIENISVDLHPMHALPRSPERVHLPHIMLPGLGRDFHSSGRIGSISSVSVETTTIHASTTSQSGNGCMELSVEETIIQLEIDQMTSAEVCVSNMNINACSDDTGNESANGVCHAVSESDVSGQPTDQQTNGFSSDANKL